MLFFPFFLLLFLSFINFCVLDYVIWWSIFVICTFVFIFMAKGMNVSCLINYYVIQEVCGYYFLVFDNWKLQFLIIMLKSGSSPFHFWLFSVLSNMKNWFILWFLTLQKLPYFFVLVNFCSDFFFVFLFFGMIFCYFQFFFLRNFLDMVIVGSSESFNWLLLLGLLSFNEVFVLFFFYYFVMLLIISYVFDNSFNFFSLEMLMIFFNVPMSLTFFLKIILLFSINSMVGLYYLFLFFIMPLMSLGIGYLFFFVSMNSFNYGLKYYDYFIYLLFCVGFLSVF